MPLKAIFFDFDGLIVDTETLDFEIWQDIFVEHGVVLPEQYWFDTMGRGTDQAKEHPVEVLARLCGRTLPTESIRLDYKARAHIRKQAEPVRPGVAELAREAQEAGIHFSVVSSSGHDWVNTNLAHRGIDALFFRRVCRQDAARSKPYPDLYLRACEVAGVLPSEAIALEDSPNGLHAANAAGIFSIAVPNPLTARVDLSHARARFETLHGVGLEDLRRALEGRKA